MRKVPYLSYKWRSTSALRLLPTHIWNRSSWTALADPYRAAAIDYFIIYVNLIVLLLYFPIKSIWIYRLIFVKAGCWSDLFVAAAVICCWWHRLKLRRWILMVTICHHRRSSIVVMINSIIDIWSDRSLRVIVLVASAVNWLAARFRGGVELCVGGLGVGADRRERENEI